MKEKNAKQENKKTPVIQQNSLCEPTSLVSQKTNLDQPLHSFMSHFAGWLSPPSFVSAYFDWLTHFNHSPDKKIEFITDVVQNNILFASYFFQNCFDQKSKAYVDVKETDHRFINDAWNQFPFNMYSQYFLMNEQIFGNATKNVRGVSRHHENLVNFITRQVFDMFSPSNFPFLNPEVIAATTEQAGANFSNGLMNWFEDVSRYTNKEIPAGLDQFKVGENIACTPGKVIFKNHLIELIQYEPTTTKVYAEPILIIPAWIMKYYILDLSPHNSMVKYMVDQGHTVFMISWKNPGSEDRDLNMEDYIELGVMDALKAITHIIPQQKIHAVGYCIGGTLLMLSAAVMARNKDERLKTISLFASQIDFKDAGELLLFIDEAQLAYLEDIMWEKGYLDGQQMAGSFSMLQSIDLIWSKNILDYQLGKRRPGNDLMAWDNDATRLPYAMHSEYLRKLFLNNDLIEGHYCINDRIVSLQDIKPPIFSVSTVKDHVAPWKSVYKVHFFTNTDITFVLTNGGHNSGVVNEPGHPGRSYQLMKHGKDEEHISPACWQAKAPHHEGSWWPAWQTWLSEYSGEKVVPPSMGNILCDAPGTYVFQA